MVVAWEHEDNVKRMSMAENMKTTSKKRGAIWEEDQCKEKDGCNLKIRRPMQKWKISTTWEHEDQCKKEEGCNLKIRRPM